MGSIAFSLSLSLLRFAPAALELASCPLYYLGRAMFSLLLLLLLLQLRLGSFSLLALQCALVGAFYGEKLLIWPLSSRFQATSMYCCVSLAPLNWQCLRRFEAANQLAPNKRATFSKISL